MPRLFSKILFFRENWKSDGKKKFDNEDDYDDDVGQKKFRTDASYCIIILFFSENWKSDEKKRKFDDDYNDNADEKRFECFLYF